MINRDKLWKLIKYSPIHEKALNFHNSNAKIQILIGGMRSGKTSATVVKVLEFLLNKPNQNCWVVALDYGLTSRFIFGKGEIKGVDTYLSLYFPFLIRSRDRKEYTLSLKTGTLIQGRSTKYINSLAAEKVNGIIVEDAEAISNTAWENYIYGRMMDSKEGFIFINTVPPKDTNHWVWNLVDKSISDKSIEFFNFLTTENKHCDQDFINNIKKNLPTSAYNRLVGNLVKETEKEPLSSSLFVGEFEPYEPGCFYKAGIDVSRFGHSRTVLSIANYTKKRVSFVDYFPKKFMKRDQFYDRIIKTLQAYNFPPIRVDSAGIGFGVYEELKRDGRLYVEDGGVKTLTRRNLVIETVILASQRGWTFPEFDELKKEFYNLVLVMKESEKTGEVKSFYAQRDKAVGTDGIMSIGLALEGFLNLEGLHGSSQNFKELMTSFGVKSVNAEDDGIIKEFHSELKETTLNELEEII